MKNGRYKITCWTVGLLWVLLLPTGAGADWEPPREPILRVETGMHTAPIRRIDVDATNRYLVTGSLDKTVRVWERATGRLLRVLRPPIGAGNVGKIYGVAISPDGRMVAAAGWTHSESGLSNSIYLFDRGTGRLRHRIPGLPNVIHHLAFRPDGGVLVATLGLTNGIRAYRTSDWTQIAEDRDYGDSSYWAAFDRGGRLVTSSDDGFLRLYSRDFRLLTKKRASGGPYPFAVSFSPDGERIAVGFIDSTKVNVLSGRDLSLLYSPDTSGEDRGSLNSVTWSADGQTLYAAGRHKVGGRRAIVTWADRGQGRRSEVPASSNTIMTLKPLQAGGIVYGAGDPAIGVLDGRGQHRPLHGPQLADYRDNREGLLVSVDGGTVQFGYKQWGKDPARFALADRLLERAPAADPALTPPRIKALGLTVEGWRNTRKPTLNGKPLQLKHYERSRSLAISPDGSRVLLGAEWSLRLFDRTGREQWKKPGPGVAWSVNIPQHGKVAVAAFADGTIRWYRLRDGEELLALFPHPDGRRWVLWTPAGYYDAAAGAEELLGWHVNQGPDREALFYSVAKFREKLYRPDVIARVLKTLDVQVALRQADRARERQTVKVDVRTSLPPVVDILEPADGTTVYKRNLLVTYLLQSPTGDPVTRLKGLVNGRPAVILPNPPVSDEEESVLLKVPKEDSIISLIAENKHGSSEAVTRRIIWGGERQAPPRPKLYVLAVGIGDYPNPEVKKLSFPAKDAREFAATLERQKGRLYRDVEVRLLPDSKATIDAILDGLEWLERVVREKDVGMLFLSGHGVKDRRGEYRFLAHQADLRRLRSTSVRGLDITQTLTGIKGKAVFFFDTCYSGSLLTVPGGKAAGDSQVDVDAVVNELTSADNGVVVFASSSGKQVSLEREEWNNGAFTKAVLEGLNGKADAKPDRKITVKELDLYVSNRVHDLTEGQQTPVTGSPKTVGDFPIVLVH